MTCQGVGIRPTLSVCEIVTGFDSGLCDEMLWPMLITVHTLENGEVEIADQIGSTVL